MAKKYRTEKYSAKTHLSKFRTSTYFRNKAYERYSKAYDRLSEKFGTQMSFKLTKQDFIEFVKEDLSIKVAGGVKRERFSPSKYAEAHVFTTLKEGRAGARNFNRNIKDLYDKIVSGKASDKEISLFNDIAKVFIDIPDDSFPTKVGLKKVRLNSTDIRSDSDKWKKIYDILKANEVSDKYMGSK